MEWAVQSMGTCGDWIDILAGAEVWKNFTPHQVVTRIPLASALLVNRETMV